jgi:16S rRNA (cytidine1402-2'-O)-methyltransferase
MIQLCNENNIPFTILPGANALVPAIVGAGFDTTEFTFLGFFPAKK